MTGVMEVELFATEGRARTGSRMGLGETILGAFFLKLRGGTLHSQKRA